FGAGRQPGPGLLDGLFRLPADTKQLDGVPSRAGVAGRHRQGLAQGALRLRGLVLPVAEVRKAFEVQAAGDVEEAAGHGAGGAGRDRGGWRLEDVVDACLREEALER